MSWPRLIWACGAFLLCISCGDSPARPKNKSLEPIQTIPPSVPYDPPTAVSPLPAESYTPGLFRDLYRVLEGQQGLDDQLALERYLVALPPFFSEPGPYPPLTDIHEDTLFAFLILAYRTMQASYEAPGNAVRIGRTLLQRALALDPALIAYNEERDPGEQVPVTDPTLQTFAENAIWAIDQLALGLPNLCESQEVLASSSFDPHDMEVHWVAEQCESSRWVEGYCEPDRWVEGQCYDQWVPESCSGGYWRDFGYYEYVCITSTDCRTVWRHRWIYMEGTCNGGYWEQYCNSGHWETGHCYNGRWIEGYCRPGHYEFYFPGGSWVFSYSVAPPECEDIREPQYAVAVSSAHILQDKYYDELHILWQAGLTALLNDPALLTSPNEETFSAIAQILEGAVNPPDPPPEAPQGSSP